MNAPEAPRHKSPHALLCDVEEFISCNRHSRDVEMRWLAQYLEDSLVGLLRGARSDSLDEASKVQVARFRLAEIATERSKREREIADLDREANKLKTVA